LPTTALGLLLTAMGPVGAASGQTLEEALAIAYASNPTLLAQRAAVRAVDEQVPKALSNWRPTVTVTGEVGRERVDTESRFFSSKEPRIPRSYAFIIEQPVFRGFRTVAEVQRAENRVRAERARLISVEQTVFLAAATAYVDVLRDQVVLEFNISNEQVLRRQLEAAQDRFAVGELTRTDVSQAEARLARAKADRIQAEGDLESARAVYRRVIGAAPEKLEKPGPVTGLPATLDEALAAAGSWNPGVLIAEFNEKAARDDVDLVVGELLPTVDITASFDQRRDAASRFSESETASVLGQITIPLYQAGLVSARVREAKQVASQGRLKVVESRRQAIEDTTRAWEALQTARARIVAFEAEIRANETALEGILQEALAGLRTVLDILDAEQELLDAKVNLVRVERDEVVASFELLSAVGRLTARELNLPVEFYDPAVHYSTVRGKFFGLGGE
jgi:TolC family type I secretion outer membrane protein